MRKRKQARIIAVLTAVVMSFVMMPQLAVPAFADSGNQAFIIGSEVLRTGAGSNASQIVYYAQNPEKNPLQWRVLAYDGSGLGRVSEEGKTTLICQSGSLFAERRWGNSHYYDSSFLRKEINTRYNKDLTDGEKSAVVARKLNNIYGPEVTDHMWALSGDELWDIPESESAIKYIGQNYYLRQTYQNEYVPEKYYTALSSGQTTGCDEYWENVVARAAFNLRNSQVLFTTAAEGSKVSGTTGPDALTEVGNYSGNEWKLTIKYGHDGFNYATAEAVSARVMRLSYTNAIAGENEYISAIAVNKDNEVIWYGRLKQVTDERGFVDINVGKLEDSDKLYVFNEQCNGDKKTDYASDLVEVNVPKFHNVTFTDEKGDVMKTEKVMDGQAAEAPDTTRQGYVFKGWSKDFSNVTQNIIVIGKWEKDSDPTPSPTPSNAAPAATEVTISVPTVSAAVVSQALQAAGGSADTVILGNSVKKIKKSSFAGTGVKTLVVQSKKLKKKSVKGSLKGSSVTTVRVQVGNAKTNKKYAKKYKSFFTKKNAGKKAKVKKY